MNAIVNAIQHMHGPLIYVIVGALVFGEAALFIGFVLPGETAVLVGGLLASRHIVSLPVLIIVVVACAIIGDSVGFEVGRRLGGRLIEIRVLARYSGGVTRAQVLVRRRGGIAVFLGRWIALLRALMPALAGTAGMRYRTFLLFNAIGGAVWGVTYTLIGYFAGNAYKRIAGTIGTGAAIVIAVAVVIGFTIWAVRRRIREHREASAPVEEVSVSTVRVSHGPDGDSVTVESLEYTSDYSAEDGDRPAPS